MSGFCELHGHWVYGIDDGAQTPQEMRAMLDAAHAQGVGKLFATPHVTPGLRPFDLSRLAERLEEAREYCTQKQYSMALEAGAEILCTPLLAGYIQQKPLPTLGNSQDVLIEFPPDLAYTELEETVSMLNRAEYTVILAHAERYACLYHRKNAYRLRAETNVRLQVNCGSLFRRGGFLKGKILENWFRAELVDYVSSDAHNCTSRPIRIKDAFETLVRKYGSDYAQRLTGLQEAGRNAE